MTQAGFFFEIIIIKSTNKKEKQNTEGTKAKLEKRKAACFNH